MFRSPLTPDQVDQLKDKWIDSLHAEIDRLTRELADAKAVHVELDDEKTAFIIWVRAWAKSHFGKWITHNTAKGAFNEYDAARRALAHPQGEQG
jgi:hypothetical protein